MIALQAGENGAGLSAMKQDGEFMQMEESQQLLSAPCLNKGEISPRSQLSVTILDIANTPDTEVADTPTQRRESNNSVSDNYAQNRLDPRTLLQERTWESRYLGKDHRRAGATFQGQVYNFLERPTGWKCFVYHCTVRNVTDNELMRLTRHMTLATAAVSRHFRRRDMKIELLVEGVSQSIASRRRKSCKQQHNNIAVIDLLNRFTLHGGQVADGLSTIKSPKHAL
ncbi:hypothetical protein LSTR_LSTR010246 [Laodelphax striatellus]|uniref:Uncharacterized protein n=1 Tax=Laodelphax striatellus TaxID=195883 RepID=A0A482WM24_LAOST|nr:hypothetical protein LSTR_LSTR010246 [Laodelphax striatellus]